jgi:voltage-gated potassium channel
VNEPAPDRKPATEVAAGDPQHAEREQFIERLHDWLETPMLVLAFVWLALFVVEILRGIGPLLQGLGHVIWALFVVEYVVGLVVVPRKLHYVRVNWLKGLALLAPALRVLRVVRVLRLARLAGVTRGARLVRIVSSLNRGMRALGASMGRRGMGYVVALTLLVTVAGAAGMFAFENEVLPTTAGEGGERGFADFGSALWWTAMMMTTMGSGYWPYSAAGRILALMLALYAFAVFGYVTATLASFFVGRDAEDEAGEVAGATAIAALHEEVVALRGELRQLSASVAQPLHGTPSDS